MNKSIISATPTDYLLRLAKFNYVAPSSINEACRLLTKYRDTAKVIAGGTDLLVSMKQGKIAPDYVVNIKNIPGLDHVNYGNEQGLTIGTLTTLQSITESTVIKEKFEALWTACNKIGTPQIRNMGTLGGNICNGGPSQDSIPALLVLDAKLKLVGPRRKRLVPIDKFLIDSFHTALNHDEILTEIVIPDPPQNSCSSFQWLSKLNEVDETLVGVAVLITTDAKLTICKDIRIGLGSIAPVPLRARRAEQILQNQVWENNLIEEAARAAAEEIKPRSRADYRKQMTSVLVRQAIFETWQKLKRNIT